MMINNHTRSTTFVARWSLPVAAAIVFAAGVGAMASAPVAGAQPPGTLCGHVANSMGSYLPVTVLSGNPDCVDAVHAASDYLTGPHPADGGTLQMMNVDGFKCYAPLVPGRSHADSYLECDGDGGAVKLGS
jgi:hypothetical protein